MHSSEHHAIQRARSEALSAGGWGTSAASNGEPYPQPVWMASPQSSWPCRRACCLKGEAHPWWLTGLPPHCGDSAGHTGPQRIVATASGVGMVNTLSEATALHLGTTQVSIPIAPSRMPSHAKVQVAPLCGDTRVLQDHPVDSEYRGWAHKAVEEVWGVGRGVGHRTGQDC